MSLKSFYAVAPSREYESYNEFDPLPQNEFIIQGGVFSI